MPTPTEIGNAISGARLGSVLPDLRTEFRGLEDSLLARVFAEIEKGTLTSSQAHWAWLELYTYRRLERRLRTRAALGTHELESMTVNVTVKEKDNG